MSGIVVTSVCALLPGEHGSDEHGNDCCHPRLAAISHPHVHVGATVGTPTLHRYAVPDALLQSMTRSGRCAMWVGLNCLERAGLIREGSGWTLAEHLRDEVGVVFASSYAQQEAALCEAAAGSGETSGSVGGGSDSGGGGGADRRKLALRMSIHANGQLAQHVRARGPNTCLSNACASTTAALSLATQALVLGEAQHMLVVAADAVLGASCYDGLVDSFVQLRAASASTSLEESVRPFGTGRNGFVFGESAVAFVLSREEDAAVASSSCPRSASPRTPAVAPPPPPPAAAPSQRRVRILTSRVANSAYHGTRIDASHVSRVLARCVDAACSKRGVTRDQMAERCLYVSHETFTERCANAEMEALRAGFGDEGARRVVITNTKAQTGHSMGACVEDVAAVVALQSGRVPAVGRRHTVAPEFADLRFADGGVYTHLKFAIHTALGLGSHVAIVVYGTEE